ncbi:MAG: restriction endonuclease subunit S [Elusimicrobiota bacterium]
MASKTLDTQSRETSDGDQAPKGWNLIRVEEVARVNESVIGPDYPHSVIEYTDIASVYKGRLGESQVLSLDAAPSRAQRIVRRNDIIISTVRPNLEHYAFVREPRTNMIASTGFAVISAKSANPRFLYYMLTSRRFTEYLTRIAESHTSAYPAFNPEIIEEAEIAVPERKEQDRIASVLGALDDKIELNRRMNESLEAMAQAIFKSWFVDGENDAKEGKIKSIASIGHDALNPGGFPEEQFDHYSIPAFDERRLPAIEKGSAIKSNKLIVPPSSILLSKLNPRIPRIWLPCVGESRRSICSTEFLVVLPRQGVLREWLYGLLSSAEFLEKFATFVTGTSGSHQRVKPESLLAMSTRIPPQPMMGRFAEVTGQIYARVAKNLTEAQVLESTRDALLPELLSGRLEVRQNEYAKA